MSIRVNWVNNNISFTNIKVYRSTTLLEGSALPTPLVTLTSGTTYLDTTSLPDTVYWYAVAITNGGETVVSYLAPTIQHSVLGPGPAELLRGDAMCGYYGPVPTTELFTPAVFQGLVNYGTAWGAVRDWDKFLFRGKILFIPRAPLVNNATWNGLYDNGLVYGVDGPGLPKGRPDKNQLVVISRDNFDFKVRCIRATNSADYALIVSASADSEVRLLHGAIYFNGAVPFSKVYALNSLDSANEYAGGKSTSSADVLGVLAEADTTNCNTTGDAPWVINSRARTMVHGWRPVLELIQPPRG